MQKENGKWSFYIYPDGVSKEFGQEYATEEDATIAALEVLGVWKANGHAYGPHGTITKQSNVVVVSGRPPF